MSVITLREIVFACSPVRGAGRGGMDCPVRLSYAALRKLGYDVAVVGEPPSVYYEIETRAGDTLRIDSDAIDGLYLALKDMLGY